MTFSDLYFHKQRLGHIISIRDSPMFSQQERRTYSR